MPIDAADIELRNATYRRFVELGRAPSPAEMVDVTSRSEAQVREGWQRLHDAHALVLDGAGEILMANPFAARPTPFRVEAAGRSWYANCGWDAFGIGAAMHTDSIVQAECADCHEPIAIEVRDGQPHDRQLWFHVLVPAASWWNEIGFT
jgi:hypothetical protein